MENRYVIINGNLHNIDELRHYGVKGMKWGHRKAQKFADKAANIRKKAGDLDKTGRDKAAALRAKGKDGKADRVLNKYKEQADRVRIDAKAYDAKSKREQRKAKFQERQAKASAFRSRGAKLVTNLLGGAFANRTYNSVIAKGGSKNEARVTTALVSLLGPIGHIAVSAMMTRDAGDKK